jgi:hypothetical protein
MKAVGRENAPFELHLRNGHEESVLYARAVIDASGTYDSPNPMGASGLPAPGERSASNQIFYGIPDVKGRDRARYEGKKALVVGSGHSAANALIELADLKMLAPATEIIWAVRRKNAKHLYGGEDRDGLPARGALGSRVRQLVEGGQLQVVGGFLAKSLRKRNGLVVVSDGSHEIAVDEVIVAAGFRPDLSILSELRISIDGAVEGTSFIAPLIDPNFHSCGSVPPHGAEQLKHPEQDLYVVGMKSYGRAPTFLMMTGYEQVRSIAAALTGDTEGARRVELVLPETGVCSIDGNSGDECCGATVAVEEAGEAVCCGTAPDGKSKENSCCSPGTISTVTTISPIKKVACCGTAAEDGSTRAEQQNAGKPCGCGVKTELLEVESR